MKAAGRSFGRKRKNNQLTILEFKKAISEDSWGKPLSKKQISRPFKMDLVRGYTKDKGKRERNQMWGYIYDKPDKSQSMHKRK